MARMFFALVGMAVSCSAASAALVITEIQAQTTSGTASTINGDWWELTNSGPGAVVLGGYQWADSEDQLGGPTPQPNFFPAISIAPGESIIILEEAAANEAAWRANWSVPASLVILATDEMIPSPSVTDTFSGLSSGGDAVFFYDPAGMLIDSYVFGAITRGTTFEQDIFSNDLGLSVIGENGAYRAANGDIGSPGFAIPAPGAASVMALAFVGAGRRRRVAR